MQWMNLIDGGRATQWIGVREAPVIITTGSVSAASTTYHTYVRRINSSMMGINGYIVINVSESKLMNLLLDQSSLDTLHILDGKNVVISSTDKALIGSVYADPSGILSSGVFIDKGAAVTLGAGVGSQSLFTGAYEPHRYFASARGRYIGIINNAAI